VHAPQVAPCGTIALAYLWTCMAEYSAIHTPPVIPSVVGAVTLVTLTEVSSRLHDLQTACIAVQHSGYIVECPRAAHRAWDASRRPAHT